MPFEMEAHNIGPPLIKIAQLTLHPLPSSWLWRLSYRLFYVIYGSWDLGVSVFPFRILDLELCCYKVNLYELSGDGQN